MIVMLGVVRPSATQEAVGPRESSFLALPPAAGPTSFVAVREQLGLKLEPIEASLPVIVIDQAERPH